MSRGRILVADDNKDIRRLIGISLRYEGYTTLEAANGEEALQVASTEVPDLLILDIMLPRMDGWQVLRHLRADTRTAGIPVVLLTGVSLRECADPESLEGVTDYLAKPFNPARLLEIIDNVLRRRELRDQRLEDSTRPKPGHVPEEIEFAVPDDQKTRLVVVAPPTQSSELLHILVGNPQFDVLLVVETGDQTGSSLARQLQVPTASELVATDLGRVDLVVVALEPIPAAVQAWAKERGAEVLGPGGLRFVHKLLRERSDSLLKERDLVRELNDRVAELSVLRDVAHVLAAPFDASQLQSKILDVVLRVARGSAAAILTYDERQECFVTLAGKALSARFAERTRISLADPLLDELLTLQRPLTIADVQERYPSVLMAAAARETWQSMVCLPMVVKDKTVGILVVGHASRHALLPQQVQLLGTLAGQLGIALDNYRLYDSSREKQAVIEQLLAKIIMAQEEERKHLAAEIHDTVAQSLAGMNSRIQIAQSLLKAQDPVQAEAVLGDLRSLISDSVKEVRQIIFNLRPSSLDDLGLVPSLDNYCKRFERDTGIAVHAQLVPMATRLPAVLETALFRIAQETLTNTRKHAQARTVWIRLRVERNQLNLKIADDGCGFRWQDVSEKFSSGESHGVAGMRERAALLGGTFSLESKEGKGSVTTVTVPLPRLEPRNSREETAS